MIETVNVTEIVVIKIAVIKIAVIRIVVIKIAAIKIVVIEIVGIKIAEIEIVVIRIAVIVIAVIEIGVIRITVIVIAVIKEGTASERKDVTEKESEIRIRNVVAIVRPSAREVRRNARIGADIEAARKIERLNVRSRIATGVRIATRKIRIVAEIEIRKILAEIRKIVAEIRKIVAKKRKIAMKIRKIAMKTRSVVAAGIVAVVQVETKRIVVNVTKNTTEKTMRAKRSM